MYNPFSLHTEECYSKYEERDTAGHIAGCMHTPGTTLFLVHLKLTVSPSLLASVADPCHSVCPRREGVGEGEEEGALQVPLEV